MYYGTDTIVAAATPPGSGAVGIVRISGPRTKSILSRLFLPVSSNFVNFRPWVMHRGRILDASGEPLDDVLAVFMPGPRSFTGEDVAEIHCHGGMAIVSAIIEAVMAFDGRPAERGEFSRRALLNGRMDLSQAEAVAEMIAAPTPKAARFALHKLDGLLSRKVEGLRAGLEDIRRQICLAVDFSEEDVDFFGRDDFMAGAGAAAAAIEELLAGHERARPWREGVSAVLAGTPNVGKSSLLNALLGRERALVSSIPGTTRDFLEESILVDGLPIKLTDTAGLRVPGDPVEKLGMEQSLQCISRADILLLVLDFTCGLEDAFKEVEAEMRDQERGEALLLWNKADLARPPDSLEKWARRQGFREVRVVSALTGEGLTELGLAIKKAALARYAAGNGSNEDPAPNIRQAAELKRAAKALALFKKDLAEGMPADICSLHIEEAAAALAGITGLDSTDEMLDNIFASFCIGK